MRCKGGNPAYVTNPNLWMKSLQENWKYWEIIKVNQFIPVYKLLENQSDRQEFRRILKMLI